MCLAIGPASAPQRGRFGALWWRVAGSPLRLLGFGAAGHLAVLGALLVLGVAVSALRLTAMGTGIAGLLLFAYALEALPAWTGRGPVHYLRYGTSWLALNLGLVVLEIDVVLRTGWAVGGAVALLAGFAVALSGVRQYRPWVRGAYRLRTMVAEIVAWALGGAILLAAFGL